MTKTNEKKLIIIGAGPGGYTAAFYAADLGMEVILIDIEPTPGGVCLLRGCIPSKALLHVGKVISEAKEANIMGIDFSSPKINIEKLRSWKESVTEKLTRGLVRLIKQRKITFIQGQAVFNSADTISIQCKDGSKQNLEFQNCIIATGSRPISLPSCNNISNKIMNSKEALDLNDIPNSLLVVGGGYIGLELGSAYARLGSEVMVVEMTDSLLPGVDGDMLRILSKRLENLFKAVLLNTKVSDIRETPEGLSVQMEKKNGKILENFDKVLIAVGRKPNSEGLGLNKIQVETDENGFIRVNEKRQTNNKNIYAIGDIASEPMLAHKAYREARIAVENILGKKSIYSPKAIPAVVFTDPEIAWCGLTETQAAKENRKVSVSKFPWSASGRATTLNRNDGMTKLIIDPDSSKILGVCICGVGAGELIGEGVVAVASELSVSDLKICIHPHPTLSESLLESAEAFLGKSTHLYKPVRKK